MEVYFKYKFITEIILAGIGIATEYRERRSNEIQGISHK